VRTDDVFAEHRLEAQDTQKFWCDLFLAHHSRFDRCLRKLSGSSFELMQDFGCFHWHFRAARSLPFIFSYGHARAVCQNIFCR
jgi:hypothetical protein